MLRRTPLLPPHRPNANGVMVRSSPSNTLPHSAHVSNFSYATRITGFEDNFVSPPSSSWQQCHPESMPGKDSHVTVPVKVPIGALMSPLHRPFGTRAAPKPYVQDPGHQPRPLTGTLSTGNISNGSVYMYQEAPPKSTAYPSRRGFAQPTANRSLVKYGHKSLTKQTSLSGSKVNLSDIEGGDDHALNSTFTVAVDVGCRGQQAGMSRVAGSTCGSTASSSSSDGGKKPGQGRGMFGRNKISKLQPSYQKMTKSAESKKLSR